MFKVGQQTNLCVLSFDDGPSKHTGRLLDLLRERGIPATFFVVGSQLRYYPDLIRRMQAEGHEVGNHTQSHMTLRHAPPEVQRKEIITVQDTLRQLGVNAHFFRPPYGRYDKQTVDLANELGLDIVLWSVDSMDWMSKARIETMQGLIRGQKLRGVFLFHDTHAPTVDAMPELLDRLIEDGCHFVTMTAFFEAMGLIQAVTTPDPGSAPQEKTVPEVPEGAERPQALNPFIQTDSVEDEAMMLP